MIVLALGVVVAYVILALYDLVPLVKERQMKEAIVYTSFTLVNLVFSVVLVFQIPIVSLSQIVERIIRMFFDI